MTFQNRKTHHPWVAISLSGPSLSSWTIPINIDLSFAEAEEELKRFKSFLDLKSKTSAFAFVPMSDEKNYLSTTLSFSKVFPKIPLTSIYNFMWLPKFCNNSVNESKLNNIF